MPLLISTTRVVLTSFLPVNWTADPLRTMADLDIGPQIQDRFFPVRIVCEDRHPPSLGSVRAVGVNLYRNFPFPAGREGSIKTDHGTTAGCFHPLDLERVAALIEDRERVGDNLSFIDFFEIKDLFFENHFRAFEKTGRTR